jgi:hypothetical protein
MKSLEDFAISNAIIFSAEKIDSNHYKCTLVRQGHTFTTNVCACDEPSLTDVLILLGHDILIVKELLTPRRYTKFLESVRDDTLLLNRGLDTSVECAPRLFVFLGPRLYMKLFSMVTGS